MIRAKDLDGFVSLFVKDFDVEYVKKGRNYFLRNEVFESISSLDAQPLFVGLPLGKDNKFFEPSLFLVELLAEKSKNKVFINAEAEWLFLCGRDVFLDNIDKNLADKDVFLVQNSRDENLGLGMKAKIKGKTMIKNLLDRGDFLRREK